MLQHYRDHIRQFSRDARLFILASVILAAGTSAPVAFAALYFRAIGFDAEWVGWVNTANQIGGALGTLPAVLLIDRIGRRRAIVIGASVSLLAWGAAVTVLQREWVMAWLAVSGAFNVLFGLAVVPLLAEVSTPYERTTLFAVRDGLTTLTVFLASLLTGFAPGWVAQWAAVGPESAPAYRAVLLGSIGLRLFALIPLVLIHDPRQRAAARLARGEENASGTPPLPFIRYLDPRVLLRLRTPVVWIGLPIVIVYFAGSLVFPFLPQFLKDKHGAGDPLVSAVLGATYLSIGVGTLAAPLLVRGLGRERLVVLAALASGLGILVMALAQSREAVIVAAVLRAGMFNLALPVYRAMVIDAAPRGEHTIAALVLSSSENIGATAAPPLSGRAQAWGGYEPVFAFAAGLYGAGAAAFAWAAKHVKSAEKPG